MCARVYMCASGHVVGILAADDAALGLHTNTGSSVEARLLSAPACCCGGGIQGNWVVSSCELQSLLCAYNWQSGALTSPLMTKCRMFVYGTWL